MSLSAATNMLKLLVDRHAGRKQQMADYLQAIAENASNLGEHWAKRYEDIVSRFKTTTELQGRKALIFDHECAASMQAFLSYSMVMYYEKFEEVFGKKNDETLNEFRDSLIKIVAARNTAKETAEREMNLLPVPEDANSRYGERFRDAVLEMHQHAAALMVLAKTFRASR